MCYMTILSEFKSTMITVINIMVAGLLATGAGLSWEEGVLNSTTRKVAHRRTLCSQDADILFDIMPVKHEFVECHRIINKGILF